MSRRTMYIVGGAVVVGVGVLLLAPSEAAAEPAPVAPDVEADLLLVDNGELLAPEPAPTLADQIGGMLKTMVPYAAGALGLDAALVGASKGAQMALGKYGVSAIGKMGGGLAALGLVGDLSELANDQLRGQAAQLLEHAAQTKQLEAYAARQTALETAAAAVNDPLDEATADLKPGTTKLLAEGVLHGVGSIATGGIEIAAVLDTTFAMHQARVAILRREQGEHAANAYQLLMGFDMAGEAVVGGLGGALADALPLTPVERAKADEVLRLLRPTEALLDLGKLEPRAKDFYVEKVEPIFEDIRDAFRPLTGSGCHCPGGTSNAGAMCKRTTGRGSERGGCKKRHDYERKSRNGLFARCPGGWVPTGGHGNYGCRNTRTPGCKEYHSKPKNCPGGWAPQNDSTCWRLESKQCA